MRQEKSREQSELFLVNLEKNISEETNVGSEYPRKVKELMDTDNTWHAGVAKKWKKILDIKESGLHPPKKRQHKVFPQLQGVR